jgi:hypothetical protein
MGSRMNSSVVCLVAAVLAGCGGNDTVEVVTHVHNATIKVRVFQLVNAGGGSTNEVAVAGATVELYKTESDRDLSINEVLEKASDTDGNVTFVNCTEAHYYLRCSHTNYGELLDDVSTPDGTVSFVEFIY